MNKYTLITLTVVLFSVFACKKDNEPETIVKQLKKAVITNPEGEVTTCHFKYQNDLIRDQV